ncbi:MAG: ABC transporter permease [Gemmatimonadaceae bacterium]
MRHLPKLRRLIRLPWRSRTRIAREIDDEFEFHLDMRANELNARGVASDDARREALQRFGDLGDAREYCRTMDERFERVQQRRSWLADLRYDMQHGLRQMARAPGVTLLIIVTLGLGIGATTAMFSVVYRLLINPVPFADGDRLYNLMRADRNGAAFVQPTGALFGAWRAGVHSLEEVSKFGKKDVTLQGTPPAEPEAVAAGILADNMMHLLRAKPMLGRSFILDETKPGAPSVAMLSYGLWQRRFAGARDVVGRSISVDGTLFTIVGVMARDFAVPFMYGMQPQIWLPEIQQSDGFGVQAVGRLRKGVTQQQLEREMTDVMTQLATTSPEYREWKGAAKRPQDYLGTTTRTLLLTLLGAVGIVLLIACANIANILLARATTRRREFIVRAALGAGQARIVRQLLAESALLAVAGGVAGLLVAWRGLALIIALRPDGLSDLDAVRLEPRILLVALAISLLTGVLFGLAPALLAARGRLGEALKGVSRSSSGDASAARVRNSLVVAEVSLSVVLLVGAGLLVQTLIQIQRAPLGFDPAGLSFAPIVLPVAHYKTATERAAAFDQLLQRARAIPGITDVAWSANVPPRTGITFGELEIAGRTLSPSDKVSVIGYNSVTPDYFRVLGIALKAGTVVSSDTSAHPVVINEKLAQRYWPGTTAVGARLRMSAEGEWSTVAGVVADVTIPNPGETSTAMSLQMYAPFDGSFEDGTLVMRSSSNMSGLFALLAREASAINPRIRIRSVESVATAMQREMARPRFNVALLTTFAALALLLSAAGLYGVIAYSVSQRAREMGIRLALGAPPRALLRLVLSQGARLTIIGLAIGLIAAAASTRLLASQLYGVSPLDPMVFLGAVAVLGAIALAASTVPALRATRVDPVVTLREE